MQSSIKNITEEPFLFIQSERFKNCIYVYLILRSLFWLNSYDLLFGEHTIVYSTYQDIGNFKDICFILLNSKSHIFSLFFLLGVVALSSFNLIFKHDRLIPDILLWLLILNLHNKVYATLTGGDFLLNQLLFYNIFLLFNFKLFSEKFQFLNILLHNGALISIIIQICIVYVLSGFAKLLDKDWQYGLALNILSEIEQFKLTGFSIQNKGFHPILIVLNYMILFYQLLFPIFISIKKIKKAFLWLGIGIHIYIMVFMGLFWFSLIMLITYVFFWPIKASKE
jgi:hypothetical protein